MPLYFNSQNNQGRKNKKYAINFMDNHYNHEENELQHGTHDFQREQHGDYDQQNHDGYGEQFSQINAAQPQEQTQMQMQMQLQQETQMKNARSYIPNEIIIDKDMMITILLIVVIIETGILFNASNTFDE